MRVEGSDQIGIVKESARFDFRYRHVDPCKQFHCFSGFFPDHLNQQGLCTDPAADNDPLRIDNNLNVADYPCDIQTF